MKIGREARTVMVIRISFGEMELDTCCICGVFDLVCQSLHFIEVIIKQIL